MRLKLEIILGICGIAGIALTGYAYQCKLPREMGIAAGNLNFAQGAPGAAPPSWFLGPEWFMPPHETVYEARIADGAACNGSRQCAMVHSIRYDPSIRLSFLYQIVDATQYRGKRLTFRAAVRTDVDTGGAARLLVRVHRNDCSTSFRDDMGDHPITASNWASYEIEAPIALDARDIEFGMQLVGQGTAWIDKISLEFGGTAR